MPRKTNKVKALPSLDKHELLKTKKPSRQKNASSTAYLEESAVMSFVELPSKYGHRDDLSYAFTLDKVQLDNMKVNSSKSRKVLTTNIISDILPVVDKTKGNKMSTNNHITKDKFKQIYHNIMWSIELGYRFALAAGLVLVTALGYFSHTINYVVLAFAMYAILSGIVILVSQFIIPKN